MRCQIFDGSKASKQNLALNKDARSLLITSMIGKKRDVGGVKNRSKKNTAKTDYPG